MIEFSNIPPHYWKHLAGQKLEWVPGDSQEQWQKNMQDPNRRAVLEKYGWDRPGVINYKFNSHGFRCDEFTKELAMIALGCSFTGGVGLPEDHIWPTLVAKQLNLKLWNLGVPGSAVDTCFRFLHYYITQLNVSLVCLLRPDENRFELWQNHGRPITISPSMPPGHSAQKIWYQHAENSRQNFIKNTMAIQHLCQQNGAKLIILDLHNDLFNTPPRDPWPPARDLAHVGTMEHAECARRFIEIYHSMTNPV